MAPLSVLPGRVRFEAGTLVGSNEGCELVEASLRSLAGVSEATASHRTGRVLVHFQEEVVSRSEVEERLTTALEAAAWHKEQDFPVSPLRRPAATRDHSSYGVSQFVMEMALHAFLPAPLDLLLPAATALRR